MVGLLCRRRPLSTLFRRDTDLREDLIIMLAQQRWCALRRAAAPVEKGRAPREGDRRSEAHTSELQLLMRTSYAVVCCNDTLTPTLYRTIPPLNSFSSFSIALL